jgi:uncharacterized protein YcfJ
MAKDSVTILIVAVSLALVFAAGCESDAQSGAGVGALIGAGTGAIIGHQTGRASEGALIGAAVGGGAGYMLGNESDKERTQAEMGALYSEVNTVTANVTNSNGSVVQVRLKKHGVGYVGPRGEYYAKLPTEDQLRPVYGF